MRKKLMSWIMTAAMVLSLLTIIPPISVRADTPTADLLAYFPFSGSAADASGNGNDGTVHGASLTTDRFGNADSAYVFNGTSDYIDVTAPIDLPDGNLARTVSAWINCSGSTAQDRYQTAVGYGTQTPDNAFFLERGGAENLGYSYVTGWKNDLKGNSTLEYGTWTHLAVTFDGTTTKIYVNGALDGGAAKSYNTVVNTEGLRIGCAPTNDGWHGFFYGSIDDVRIYDGALTEVEIAAIASDTIPAPTLQSAATSVDGSKIVLSFDKAMADPSGKHAQFSVVSSGSGNAVTAATLGTDTKTIELTLTTPVVYGQIVKASYTAGTVAAADGGMLTAFTDQMVTNPPSASAVDIAGTAAVGQTVSGSYTYNKGSASNEGDSAFRWLRVSGTPSLLGQPYILYANLNLAGVGSGPSSQAQFTVSGSSYISKISNYHYNFGYIPGTISLVGADSTAYGPWNTTNEIGSYWCIYPDIELPAGTYTVIDLNPASWSCNPGSGNAGMTEIVGYTMISGASEKNYTLQAADSGHRILFEVTPKDGDGHQGLAVMSVAFGPVEAPLDTDGDGVLDTIDNAPYISNPDQADADGDGIGDVADNAPNVSNPGQEDADNDGVGDVIDSNAVTIGPLSNGTITANPTTAVSGTTINLTITPAPGKQLKAGTLKYNNGTDHAISATSFLMPGSAVTVTAQFEDVNQAPVITSNWNYTTVYFGKNYPYTLTVTDAENTSGTKIFSSLDTAPYAVVWIYPGAPGTQNITLSPLKGVLAAGSHTLRYYAQDTGGATSQILTLTFTATDEPTNTGGGGGRSSSSPEPGNGITVSTSDGSSSVSGALTKTDGGTQVVIKNSDFNQINATDKPAVVNAQVAAVTFDKKAMDTIGTAAGSSDVTLTVRSVPTSELSAAQRTLVGSRPVYDFTVTGGGKTISNFNGGHATVSIPHTLAAGENPHAIVIWYLSDSGKLVGMRGHYDAAAKAVVFRTPHFSSFVVGYNPTSFKDVPAGVWHESAVTFLAARDITTGTGDGKFSPDAALTRGQFIVMLMRAYGIEPDASPADNFADAGSIYYTNYLAAAKRLGISNSIGNNLFAPDRKITRQEMFTLLYNALTVIGEFPEGNSGKKLSDFSDASDIAPWASNSMELLVETGTISGSDGKLSPSDSTTRSEMTEVLYNLLTK